MILKVMTVYDKAVNAYLQPFFCRSLGEAIRSFTDLANDPKSNVAQHPTDFVLMLLGDFDDGTGLFMTGEPQRVMAATETLKE